MRVLAVLFAFVLTGCSGFRIVDALTPKGGYVATRDIAYGVGERRRLDVYRPTKLATAAQAPVVVFFYGGNWREGSKADYRFVADALTSRGIVTVIADYRVYPEVGYPGFVEDAAAATAWVRREIARYGGDSERIILAGHSAGAYNAAMIAYDPRWLAPHGLAPSQFRGFVGLAGPYDFLPIQDPGVKEVFDWPRTPRDSQPIEHVGRDSIPALLIAARKDDAVHTDRNTEPMAERLRAEGIEVSVAIHTGVGHVTLVGALSRPLRPLAPVLDEFSAFVLSH